MEEPIRIPSGSNELFGMLHSPNEGSSRAAILVVNSRVEYRAGPHRFYVRAARRWSEEGFSVLRVDYPGNGDSLGAEQYAHMDSFPVDPAVDAIDFLRSELGATHVVVAGLCMGARNALYAAAKARDVHHLIAFAMPFSDATPDIAMGNEAETKTIGTAVAKKSVSGYLKRMAKPEAWLRFLTGKSDYGVIRRVLPAALGIGQEGIFKEPIFRSLHTLLERQGRVLFLFGTNDVFLRDFQDQFAFVQRRLPADAAGCSVQFIDDANHTFSRVKWQDEAIETSVSWLEQQFPGSGAAH